MEGKRTINEGYGPLVQIDHSAYVQWKTNASHLLAVVCGEASQHLVRFIKAEELSMVRGYHDCLVDGAAIFRTAEDDFNSGLLNSMRNLIQAELFDSELEQAHELHSAGYHSAAVVTAGVVLETGIRQLCKDNDIVPSKLDRMNADLAKAGVYSALVQKQVLALAAIRNSAAHGESDKYTKDDVGAMISSVGRLVGEWLA